MRMPSDPNIMLLQILTYSKSYSKINASLLKHLPILLMKLLIYLVKIYVICDSYKPLQL